MSVLPVRFIGRGLTNERHMRHLSSGPQSSTGDARALLAYIADLELEVDRLRRQSRFVLDEVRETLKRVRFFCADREGSDECHPRLSGVYQETTHLAEV